MKTVFDNRQCAHVWAQQSQEHGRSASMSFRGPVLYSYQTPIAAFVQGRGNERVVLFNSRKYSMTTSGKHMPAAHQAVPSEMRTFTVPHCQPYGSQHLENLAHLVAEYKAYSATLMRVREMFRYEHETLERLESNAKDYARVFGFDLPAIDSRIDWHAAAERIARLDADPKRQARKAAKAAEREAANASRLAKKKPSNTRSNSPRFAWGWRGTRFATLKAARICA